jgi:CRP-like cAMP-binding protein
MRAPVRRRSDDRIDALRRLPLFAGLSDKRLAWATTMVDPFEVAPGAVLVNEGAYGKHVFVIVSGSASVTVGAESLPPVGPGDVIGEMGVLDHAPRAATVTAATPMELLAIDQLTFTDLLREPGVARRIMQGMAERLRRADRRTARV